MDGYDAAAENGAVMAGNEDVVKFAMDDGNAVDDVEVAGFAIVAGFTVVNIEAGTAEADLYNGLRGLPA